MNKECVVCVGKKYEKFKSFRCEKHDICDKCKKKRSELEEIYSGTETGFICQPCKDQENKEYIEAYEEVSDSCDFSNDSFIKCPYCGYENDSTDTHESDYEYICEKCDSIFEVEVEYSVTYSTRKKTEVSDD